MTGVLETHHPADLATFHKNPRIGDTEAIAASLRVNGLYKPLVVNRGTHTGRPMEVLAGNHTLKAIRQLAETYMSDDRWQKVECWVLDVDDDRASRIVLADNRTNELGGMDADVLMDLLEQFDTLEGSGYSDADMEALLAETSDSLNELEDFLDRHNSEDSDEDEDEDEDEGEDEGEDEDAPPSDLWLAITFSVTPDQRSRIRLVLNEIKEREGLDTQTDALIFAIDHVHGFDADQIVADGKEAIHRAVHGDPATDQGENE